MRVGPRRSVSGSRVRRCWRRRRRLGFGGRRLALGRARRPRFVGRDCVRLRRGARRLVRSRADAARHEGGAVVRMGRESSTQRRPDREDEGPDEQEADRSGNDRSSFVLASAWRLGLLRIPWFVRGLGRLRWPPEGCQQEDGVAQEQRGPSPREGLRTHATAGLSRANPAITTKRVSGDQPFSGLPHAAFAPDFCGSESLMGRR